MEEGVDEEEEDEEEDEEEEEEEEEEVAEGEEEGEDVEGNKVDYVGVKIYLTLIRKNICFVLP